MTTRNLANGPLAIALFATLSLIVILTPMSSVVLWSVILTILFANVNERLVRRLGSRNRASVATILLILVLAVAPALIISVLIANQIGILAAHSDQIAASLQSMTAGFIERLPTALQAELGKMIAPANINAERVGNMIMRLLGYTVSIGGNLAAFAGTVLAALYVTFFLMRDRAEILRYLSHLVPLQQHQKAALSVKLANTVTATVRGVILVAVAQALAAGVIYWLLGLQSYAVLAALTFVGCFLPAIGSGLVWVPVSIYFFLTGDVTKGGIMVASGVFVISMVDNILRPRLIGESAGLPDFLIFLSSIGGLLLIGFDGLFLGPIVAGFFVASWNVYLGLTDDSTDAPAVAGSEIPSPN